MRVVATFIDIPSLMNQEIAQLVATSSPDDPDHGFDVVSAAAYFGPDDASFNAETTVQQILAAGMSALTGVFEQQLQGFMLATASWESKLGRQIPVMMYEGGWDLNPKSDSFSWESAPTLPPKPTPVNTRLPPRFLNELEDAGVTGLNYYEFIGGPGPYGEFGTMDYLGQPSSETPKYNALVAFTSSPSLVLTGFPSTTTAGSPNDLTVIAYGPDGKIDTDFTGTVEFTSSDPKAVLPASYTFTSADGGVHTFPISLHSAGLQSITVTDAADGLSREQSFITVQPSKAVSLAVTGFPNPDTAGVANPFEVTFYDAYGNVATG